MIGNCQKCFTRTLGLKTNTAFDCVSELNNVIPASWNHAIVVFGQFDLTKLGCKFGLTHLVFTIHMQIVWFYVRSSCS